MQNSESKNTLDRRRREQAHEQGRQELTATTTRQGVKETHTQTLMNRRGAGEEGGGRRREEEGGGGQVG